MYIYACTTTTPICLLIFSLQNQMTHVRIHVRYSSHDFAISASSQSLDLTGWQAKMASVELWLWIPWRNAQSPVNFAKPKCASSCLQSCGGLCDINLTYSRKPSKPGSGLLPVQSAACRSTLDKNWTPANLICIKSESKNLRWELEFSAM